MLTGIVSNCWKTQLDAGLPLDDLLAEASRRGYRAVELRQTCLGEYETHGDHLPIAERLQNIPSRFPQIRFNVAIDVPFLTVPFDQSDPLFVAGCRAADALAGESFPHLRLVDLSTSGEQLDRSDIGRIAASVVKLVEAVTELGGVLSIEQSRQSWRSFHSVWDTARGLSGANADRLRLCYDPCNLLIADRTTPEIDIDPDQVTASLTAECVSMLHLKQRRAGDICPDIRDGAIDWREQAAILRRIGFDGPALFEVAPHGRVWKLLDDSINYLRQQGLNIAGPDG